MLEEFMDDQPIRGELPIPPKESPFKGIPSKEPCVYYAIETTIDIKSKKTLKERTYYFIPAKVRDSEGREAIIPIGGAKSPEEALKGYETIWSFQRQPKVQEKLKLVIQHEIELQPANSVVDIPDEKKGIRFRVAYRFVKRGKELKSGIGDWFLSLFLSIFD